MSLILPIIAKQDLGILKSHSELNPLFAVNYLLNLGVRWIYRNWPKKHVKRMKDGYLRNNQAPVVVTSDPVEERRTTRSNDFGSDMKERSRKR